MQVRLTYRVSVFRCLMVVGLVLCVALSNYAKAQAIKIKTSVFVLNGKVVNYNKVAKLNSNEIVSFYASRKTTSRFYSSRSIPDTVYLTTKTSVKADAKLDTLIVLNRDEYSGKFGDLFKLDDLLSVEILKSGKGSVVHDPPKVSVIALTKKFAEQYYKKKISEVSSEYKDLISPSEDDVYPYYVNGKIIVSIDIDKTLKLYNAACDGIKDVKIVRKYPSTYQAATYIHISTEK